MKVVITEKIHDAGIALLQEYFQEVVYAYNMDQPSFLSLCERENPDAIVIRGIPYKITPELVKKTPNLKAIGSNVVDPSNVDDCVKEKSL